MANFIPKIEYIELYTLDSKIITFTTQPEEDPFNEELKGVYKETMSSSGNFQRQWNYNEQSYDLSFKFETSAVKDLMIEFIKDHAMRGGSFDYYPSSDETAYETFRLESNSFKLDRPIFEGEGPEFLYDFKFSIKRTLDFVLEVPGAVMGVGSIGETVSTILNNQSSPINIDDLVFDKTIVRCAFIDYVVYRNTTTTELNETGDMVVSYSNVAGTWSIKRNSVGESGLEITVTNLGQLQYTSSNLTGTAVTSTITFRASTLAQ